MKPLALRLVPSLVLLLIPAALVFAQGSPSSAEEDMAVARARLKLVLDKVRAVPKSGRPDGGVVRKDILRRGDRLMNGPRVSPTDERAAEIIASMDALREEGRAFLDGEAPDADAPITNPALLKGTSAEIRAFRDVSQDAELVMPNLTAEERDLVRGISREGESLIQEIDDIRSRDHATREVMLLELREKRSMLADLWRRGSSPRTVGHPFVALARTSQLWTESREVQGDLEMLRTRFIAPQSAHVTVRNAGSSAREASVRLEFLDVAGEPTGSAEGGTGPVDLLEPGEVRELLLLIDAEVPHFWDDTRTFTVDMR